MNACCRTVLLLLIWCLNISAEPFQHLDLSQYDLKSSLIDVVIPCAKKDLRTLELCIKGIKQNGINIRRIIVVSEKRYTSNAEWFDEAFFPFTKLDMSLQLFSNDKEKALNYLSAHKHTAGWIFQQLLKLYAPLVIPDISPNVLMLDADTIFLTPVEFMNEDGQALFNARTMFVQSYLNHLKKVLPDLELYSEQYSGVTHHMLFQRPVLEHLFDTLSDRYHCEPWKALLQCINNPIKGCLSEYEIYFNYYYAITGHLNLRLLKWWNIPSLRLLNRYKNEGAHYISCHKMV